MVELIAAIVVFNLLIAGLVKLFIGQNSLVENMEGWAEGNPVMYVSQEVDPLARALGMPAKLQETPVPAVGFIQNNSAEYLVEVLQVSRQAGSESASASFLQTKSKDGGKDDGKDDGKDGGKDGGKDRGKDGGKDGGKGRGKE